MSTRTKASFPSGTAIRIATGAYVGNGAATQAIVGVGFQPKYVLIYQQTNLSAAGRCPTWKTDVDGLNAYLYVVIGSIMDYNVDYIISLDADGFTVGDSDALAINILNTNAAVYSYVCIAAP